MHRWSPGRSLLLALSLFVILSHVCALPAHAAGLDTVLGHTDAAHDHHAGDESVHGGSCEAVRSTAVVQPQPAPAPAVAGVPVVRLLVRPTPERARPAIAASPPLFLLHASLLI
jgi:hypothetical protein